MSKKMTAYAFKNKAGKTFYVREPEIQDMETVAKVVGSLKENEAVKALRSQEEMAKTLLVGIEEKDGTKKEIGLTFSIKEELTFKEYAFLLKCIAKLTEDEDEGNEPEIVTL